MDVQCEKCKTEYSLDETLVSPSGTSVRCTSCGHVFKAFPPKAAAPGETWILRQVGGATFPFDRIAVLQDWISQGKVSVDDQISKGGGPWKRLGDISEMKPFFDAAHAARATQPDTRPVAAGFPGAQPVKGHQSTMRHAAMKAPSSTQEFAIQSTAQVKKKDETVPMARPVSRPVQKYAPTGAQGASAQNQSTGQLPAMVNVTADTVPSTPSPVMQNAPTMPATQTPNFATGPTMPQTPSPVSPTKDTVPAVGASVPPVDPKDMYHPSKEMVSMVQTVTVPSGNAPPEDPNRKPTKVASTVDTQKPTMAHISPPRDPQTHREEPDMSQVPATRESGWQDTARPAATDPAWAEQDSPLPSAVEEEFASDRPHKKPKVLRWVVLFLVLALVGGGFYMFFYQRQTVDEVLGSLMSSTDDDRYQAFFLKGKESFLLDTDEAFTQADREYHQVLALKDDHVPTLAALATMYAVWAQYLLDDELNVLADLPGGTDPGNDPRVTAIRKDRNSKLRFAQDWAQKALAKDPSFPEAHLAMADALRLMADETGAADHLNKGRSGETAAQAGYIAALMAVDKGTNTNQVLGMLEASATTEPLLRTLYRKARLLAHAGQNEKAKAVLSEILATNGDHLRAKALSSRIDSGGETLLVLETEPPATQDAGPAPVEEGDESSPKEEKSPQSPPGASQGEGAPKAGGSSGGGSPESMLMRAAKLQERGKTAEAMDLFEAVLARSPGNIDALNGLAYCYLDRGSKTQAIAHFRRALKVNSSYGPAMIGLAQTYKAQGQKQQALTWFKKYLAQHPTGRHAPLAKRNAETLEQELGSSPSEPTEPAAHTGGPQDQPKPQTDPAPSAEPEKEKASQPSAPEPAPADPPSPPATGGPVVNEAPATAG